MRTAILAGLIAATLTPAIAQAQSAQELRHDRRDIRDERRDVARAERRGASPAEVRHERRDVRDARREYRDDWRDYRRAHPAAWRSAGRYRGPHGYRYRSVNVGYRFAPAYYSQRYWIDPYRYHLRPVHGRQRWVRYGNDVLLIDTRTGRVLEVHNRFFF